MGKALRKTKKNWRKNIDLDDIEKGLDIGADERIVLGKLHDELEDELIFKEDVEGLDSLRQEAKKLKTLKVDEILTPQSKISPMFSRKSALSSSAANLLISEKDLKPGKICKALKSQVSKAKCHLKNKNALKKVPKSKDGEAIFDLWDTDTNEIVTKAAGHEDITKKLPASVREGGFVEHLKPIAVKAPLSVNRPAATVKPVAAVKVVEGGASYNPSAAEHGELTAKAIDEELRRLERIEYYQSKMTLENFFSNSATPDMIVDSDAGVEEEIEENEEDKADRVAQVSLPKRKTTAQKNRQKRHRLKLFEEWRARQKKQLIGQIDQLHLLKRQLEESGAWEQASKDLETEKGKFRSLNDLLAGKEVTEKSKPARLGPHIWKKPFVEVQLTEDLTPSFRQLKPEGNLMADRFGSLQERQLIETRVRVGKRQRYKRKSYEIPSYRFYDKKLLKFSDKV